MNTGPLHLGAEWIRAVGQEADVVMSSRVRLARNLADLPFPNSASAEQKRETMRLLRQATTDESVDPSFGEPAPDARLLWVDLTQVSPTERAMLYERHLISKQHAKGDEPRAVLISAPDEWLSVMINEEDHLRMQVMRSGLALSEAFERINRVDDAIEARVPYAFNPRFGYLTACPTNVGTGIRVSVMLHLPALRLVGEMDKVRRAAKSMNLAVRGFYGEGSEAAGDIYQISNQTTVGRPERDILQDFERQIVPQVIEYERTAREALLRKRRVMFEDKAHRALALLRSARLLATEEALHALSLVRLGLHTRVLSGVDAEAVTHLVLLLQPAHLQRAVGRDMDQGERREARAKLCRERLAGS